MTRRFFLFLTLLIPFFCRAEEPLPFGTSKLRFATAEEAGKFLAVEDDYFRAMGPVHRSIILKSVNETSLDDLRKHVATCGLDWTDEEKQTYSAAFTSLAPEITRLNLRLPEEVLLIKTNSDEDMGSPYTRRNAIIFPDKRLKEFPRGMLRFVAAHELSHVFSRHNPAKRDALYAVFGFEPAKEPPKPENWTTQRITNPDAPECVHALRAKLADGTEVRAIPFLMSRRPAFDPKARKSLGAYLNVVWFEVPGEATAKPRTFKERDFVDFATRTGGNTGYTIHPEEITADNFAHLLTGSKDVRTPEKLKQLEEIVREAGK